MGLLYNGSSWLGEVEDEAAEVAALLPHIREYRQFKYATTFLEGKMAERVVRG